MAKWLKLLIVVLGVTIVNPAGEKINFLFIFSQKFGHKMVQAIFAMHVTNIKFYYEVKIMILLEGSFLVVLLNTFPTCIHVLL